MTPSEAQMVAERYCNNPKACNITLEEIRNALAVLGNFYEDNRRRKKSYNGIKLYETLLKNHAQGVKDEKKRVLD